MFLHLGKNERVLKREVVGIFDLDTASLSGDTRTFLAEMQTAKKVVNLSNDLPKSFVLTENELTDTIYICGLSSAALAKRD